jgi:hypothetical protein
MIEFWIKLPKNWKYGWYWKPHLEKDDWGAIIFNWVFFGFKIEA